ncbi:MAG: DUF1080 domain-containing protein [Kiritimatiellae bacterium]|nr:DUF1080 domain-containing protein [Kiritimatiellia bacterium]
MELKKQCGEKVRVIRIHDRGNGCITTKEAYRDYRVQVEYRWTGQSYLGRSWKCHDSGFLFHSQGPDGMYHGTWKWSFEANMIQSRTPDFITVVLRGYAVPPKPFTYMATVPHFFLNGEKTLEAYGLHPTEGQLQIQSQGSDCEVRRVTLMPNPLAGRVFQKKAGKSK